MIKQVTNIKSESNGTTFNINAANTALKQSTYQLTANQSSDCNISATNKIASRGGVLNDVLGLKDTF